MTMLRPTPLPATLSEAACRVLSEPEPKAKVDLTRTYAEAWATGQLTDIGARKPPERPARPLRPELKAPRDMPKRNSRGTSGRRVFLHAIAHIELNAIDLAWDLVCRFTHEDMPSAFYDDWVGVALDEANHFDLLEMRLQDLGCRYGDLPAHDGLWQAALTTQDDLAARLALVPMVLEARGLDTTPGAVEKLTQAGDMESAALLQKIGNEEIPHVAAGVRWFEFLCKRRKQPPIPRFRELVDSRFKGQLKPPFNHSARSTAQMSAAYYQ